MNRKPWCIHCQAETEDILRNIGQFKETRIYTYFKAPRVPYTAIFDSKKRLKQAITNQAEANKLALAAAE